MRCDQVDETYLLFPDSSVCWQPAPQECEEAPRWSFALWSFWNCEHPQALKLSRENSRLHLKSASQAFSDQLLSRGLCGAACRFRVAMRPIISNAVTHVPPCWRPVRTSSHREQRRTLILSPEYPRSRRTQFACYPLEGD